MTISVNGSFGNLYNSKKPKKRVAGEEMNEQQFQTFKDKRYNEIYAHEKAHQSTGGSLAGGIHIDKDSNGIAFAGHVPIKMPPVDEQNPTLSKTQAQTVKNAALAPSDPSSQDYIVAAEAMAIMNKADLAIKNKNS